MKPIKCPNCGKNMTHSHCNIRGIVWMECATINGCGVCGPKVLILKGMDVAARLAARLTREWIARMEADTNALVNHKAREVEYLTEKRCAEELRNIFESTPFGFNVPLGELLEKWEVTP